MRHSDTSGGVNARKMEEILAKFRVGTSKVEAGPRGRRGKSEEEEEEEEETT